MGFSVLTERFLLRDLVGFFIAYLLNTFFSVAVKRGGLYRTESDYKGMRSGHVTAIPGNLLTCCD